MTLFDDLKFYIDGNGLVSPKRLPVGTKRGSDNGILFTSQAFLLEQDINFLIAMYKCINLSGELHRAPDDTSPDAPDDYYGLLSAEAAYSLHGTIALRKLPAPHPVLIYLWLLSSPYYPMAVILSPIVAIITALSNLNSPKEDTSNRLLTWTFCQALKRRSLLPNLAARFWEWRQRRTYGSISNLFAIYFEAGHPFITKVGK